MRRAFRYKRKYWAVTFCGGCVFTLFFSLSRFLCRNGGMDGDERATSERILLEPYKYLLQLPGESICRALRFYFWLHVQYSGAEGINHTKYKFIYSPCHETETLFCGTWGKTDKIFTLEQKQTEFLGCYLIVWQNVSYFEYVKWRIRWKQLDS